LRRLGITMLHSAANPERLSGAHLLPSRISRQYFENRFSDRRGHRGEVGLVVRAGAVLPRSPARPLARTRVKRPCTTEHTKHRRDKQRHHEDHHTERGGIDEQKRFLLCRALTMASDSYIGSSFF
jgi:hypothetical protein